MSSITLASLASKASSRSGRTRDINPVVRQIGLRARTRTLRRICNGGLNNRTGPVGHQPLIVSVHLGASGPPVLWMRMAWVKGRSSSLSFG
jgi:hypothetical protein